MCGIAGFAGKGSGSILRQMGKVIERRGPNDEGFYETDDVGFAFRRLSIIDVAGGHQPLSNEDQKVWVMLNGEIYNFQSIRPELEKRGHHFSTKSDTEVIAHGYEEWGDTVFDHLDGMFAIAIWDVSKKRLLLGRDRLGKKPLYWSVQNQTLWFASELKSLLAAGISKQLDPLSVNLLFRTDSVPTPKSIFQHVQKLEPGSALAWSQGRIEKQWTFWNCPKNNPSQKNKTEKEVLSELRQKIDAAVSRRLISDVPLGLFLSGGLDSSVIAESASRQAGHRLQAFTIGFDDPTYDERQSARDVAKAFHIELHEDVLKPEDLLSDLTQLSMVADEPISDPAILPQLRLAAFAKKSVTVALTGDGGDELLLGYPHVKAHELRNAFDFIPLSLWKGLAGILESYPATDGYFSRGFKLQRLARGLAESNMWSRDLAWRGATTRRGVSQLFTKDFQQQFSETFAEDLVQRLAQQSDGDEWKQWSWMYLRSYLLDTVLVKVDRATMWHGIEARSPILDTAVVEFLLTLPSSWKRGGHSKKWLFRQLLADRLAPEILNRPKHGFGVPVAAWMNGPLKSLMDECSDPTFLRKQAIFQPETIKTWREEHAKGRPDRRKELWTFLIFQLWYRQWMNSL